MAGAVALATVNQCIHEAGRALEPVVEAEIRAAVRDAEVLYADETSWKEHAKGLWLWRFACRTATLFVVGRRTREVVEQVLGEHFAQWLTSDGYGVYRHLEQRLRCLSHIVYKAKGLEELFDRHAQREYSDRIRTPIPIQTGHQSDIKADSIPT